ncbi:MAG TPA: hydroxymethylglutaryl-CoA lyase [Pseudobdellovibrionaceae bacterium]|nr:hydroxymethylglutaryl-CoA lyase [Pseudobdellovibrionaceae bacterium]
MKVKITEVGLRDGLQNEKFVLSTDVRLELAKRLAGAGVRRLELGAFVSPKWVPQMAGSADLVKAAVGAAEFRDVQISALVPNERGLDEALQVRAPRIAIFASATESFSLKNINCSIEESFTRYAAVVKRARRQKLSVRGYLSMCFGCAFEGEVKESVVIRLAARLIEMGCDEVSIGDTIGVADPKQVRRLGAKLLRELGPRRTTMHFHDTRGTALANILASLDLGITSFDSSIAGLGGCPYAPSATGNVATEDVVYMLERMGLKTDLNLDALIETNRWLQGKMKRELPSKVGRAGRAHPLGVVRSSDPS